MSLTFLTPLAGLVALVGVVALAVTFGGERRRASLCRLLGVEPPPGRSTRDVKIALVALAALVGIAAAQPVSTTQGDIRGRTDAEVFYVFDVTRSMGARLSPQAPDRLTRARREALALRDGIPGVPAGVASFTDRLLPHLFGTLSVNSFTAVIDRSLGLDKPRAQLPWGNANGTRLAVVGDLATQNYYDRSTTRRVAVVFTDGETRGISVSSLASRLARGHVRLFFVHVWQPDERVFEPGGVVNPYYQSDPTSTARLRSVAAALGTQAFDESQIPSAAAAIRDVIGRGATGVRGHELQSRGLAPFVLLLGLLPLGWILWRRNLADAFAAPVAGAS